MHRSGQCSESMKVHRKNGLAPIVPDFSISDCIGIQCHLESHESTARSNQDFFFPDELISDWSCTGQSIRHDEKIRGGGFCFKSLQVREKLDEMTTREQRGLMPGGTGGRGSPSASEDQSAENGWRGIAVLEGHLEGSPRVPARDSAASAPPTPVAPAEDVCGPTLPPPMQTGNRIVNVPLLEEFLEQNCACKDCAEDKA